MRKLKLTRSAIAVASAALLTAGLGSAIAAVTVYDNDFSSRAEFKQIIKSGGGKRCDRSFRKKGESMRAAVKRSPTTCSFRPPVQGDNELPNHDVRVDGKILKRTEKRLRGGAFVELTVRAGGGGVGYALRVFPHKQRFELSRGPAGGEFPVRGKSNAIKRVNKRNQLRLVASGSTVTAFVNGKELAKATDGNPGQVTGTKLRFALGSQEQKQGKVAATFKKVVVAVP
ncbi:MAG: hypothetical protein K0R88_1681 [Solirubrobacterales bacterium]|jgi:hypothetical protein|nr:hypothetical protein [Solirubrobacterales bacterium]